MDEPVGAMDFYRRMCSTMADKLDTLPPDTQAKAIFKLMELINFCMDSEIRMSALSLLKSLDINNDLTECMQILSAYSGSNSGELSDSIEKFLNVRGEIISDMISTVRDIMNGDVEYDDDDGADDDDYDGQTNDYAEDVFSILDYQDDENDDDPDDKR